MSVMWQEIDRAMMLQLLEQLGPELRMPAVRRIDFDLHELRSGKYRLYFTWSSDGPLFVAYGEKDTQQRDIARARRRSRGE